MDSELKLYQQVHAKLRKYPRAVQVRTLEWVAKKLYEEDLESSGAAAPPELPSE